MMYTPERPMCPPIPCVENTFDIDVCPNSCACACQVTDTAYATDMDPPITTTSTASRPHDRGDHDQNDKDDQVSETVRFPQSENVDDHYHTDNINDHCEDESDDESFLVSIFGDQPEGRKRIADWKERVKEERQSKRQREKERREMKEDYQWWVLKQIAKAVREKEIKE